MSNLLKTSIKLRRFHLAILLIITAICAWMMIRYIEMIRVRFEHITFSTSLTNIRNMFTVKGVLKQITDPECHFLDDPDLFKLRLNSVSELYSTGIAQESQASYWQYKSSQHQLIYHMKPSPYFHSSIGSQIIVTLICNHGKVSLEISSHQWCQEMSFRGCLS